MNLCEGVLTAIFFYLLLHWLEATTLVPSISGSKGNPALLGIDCGHRAGRGADGQHVHAHGCLVQTSIFAAVMKCWHTPCFFTCGFYITYVSTLLKLHIVAAFWSTTSRPTAHCFVEKRSGTNQNWKTTQNSLVSVIPTYCLKYKWRLKLKSHKSVDRWISRDSPTYQKIQRQVTKWSSR